MNKGLFLVFLLVALISVSTAQFLGGLGGGFGGGFGGPIGALRREELILQEERVLLEEERVLLEEEILLGGGGLLF